MGTRTVRMLHPDHEDLPCSSEPIDNAGSLSSPEYRPTGLVWAQMNLKFRGRSSLMAFCSVAKGVPPKLRLP